MVKMPQRDPELLSTQDQCSVRRRRVSFHDRVDVSELAKKFGGGGHKKAAGFTLPSDRHVDSLFEAE
jgi:nanoRNase/pAp phosphatase (c-di-AMP/oligoRNAs hydrolase)